MSVWSLRGASIRYDLDANEITIGRSPQCHIVIKSRSVNAEHAKIRMSSPSIFIEDLNTVSGTFVNDHRLRHQRVTLEHGDILRFGFDVASYRVEYTAEKSKEPKGNDDDNVEIVKVTPESANTERNTITFPSATGKTTLPLDEGHPSSSGPQNLPRSSVQTPFPARAPHSSSSSSSTHESENIPESKPDSHQDDNNLESLSTVEAMGEYSESKNKPHAGANRYAAGSTDGMNPNTNAVVPDRDSNKIQELKENATNSRLGSQRHIEYLQNRIQGIEKYARDLQKELSRYRVALHEARESLKEHEQKKERASASEQVNEALKQRLKERDQEVMQLRNAVMNDHTILDHEGREWDNGVYSEANDEMTRLRMLVRRQSQDIVRLRHENTELEKRRDHAEYGWTRREKERQYLEQTVDSLSSRVQSLSDKYLELTQERIEKNKDWCDFVVNAAAGDHQNGSQGDNQDRNDSSMRRLASQFLVKEIDEATNRGDALYSENTLMKSHVKLLKEQKETLENTVQELKMKLNRTSKDWEEEIQALKDEVKTLTIEGGVERVRVMREAWDDTRHQLHSIESKVYFYKTEHSKLLKNVKHFDSGPCISNLNQQIDEQQKKIQLLQNNVTQLQQKIQIQEDPYPNPIPPSINSRIEHVDTGPPTNIGDSGYQHHDQRYSDTKSSTSREEEEDQDKNQEKRNTNNYK